ncbi:MAG: DUF4974 domain-containing protein [Bacteroidetes bacterium]|nr:MAG: DUF4974 domain-containing protein [Bacteroidota bacterium]
MELNNEHIDELIAKYLAGEALPDEALQLDEWKSMSAENEAYFKSCYEAFHQVAYKPTDQTKMFARILSSIDIPEQKPKVISIRTYFTPMRIAASILVVSLIGVFVAMFRQNNINEVSIASLDSIKTEVLKDGSTVVLNKQAKLTFSENYSLKERKLKLEGEAFFEVKHDENKPFVIEAGGVLIKDIGTAFNVKANPQSDTVFVLVTEGVVEMESASKQIRLAQNESAIYIKSTQTIIANALVLPNAASYKTKMFSFKDQTLGELVETINQVYGPVLVVANKKLEACRITVDFNNESPETMAIVLSETLGLTYKQIGNQFILNGEVCVQ